jgi:hypothetical protein
VDRVRTIDIYTIDGWLSAKDLKQAAAGPLSAPHLCKRGLSHGIGISLPPTPRGLPNKLF